MEIYIFITAESNFVFPVKKRLNELLFFIFSFSNGIEIAVVNKVQYACIRILKKTWVHIAIKLSQILVAVDTLVVLSRANCINMLLEIK